MKLHIVGLMLLGVSAVQAGQPAPATKHFIVGADHHSIPPISAIKQPVSSEKSRTVEGNKPCWMCQMGEQQAICQAFFSPHDDVRSVLLDLIEREQKAISISIFTFTDKKVAQALIDKTRKGIVVEIITDKQSLRDRFSKIPFLVDNGVPVYVYKPELTQGMYNDIMHHKFVIFERNIQNKPLLWTGSFNFTQSATLKNCENVVVIDDPRLIAQYKTHMQDLKMLIGAPEKRDKTKQLNGTVETMVDIQAAPGTKTTQKAKRKAIKKS